MSARDAELLFHHSDLLNCYVKLLKTMGYFRVDKKEEMYTQVVKTAAASATAEKAPLAFVKIPP